MQAKNPKILESCTKDRHEWCKLSILLSHMYIYCVLAKVSLNTAYAKAASHSLNIVKIHRTTHTNRGI